MKKIFIALLFFITVTVHAQIPARPSPPRLVNDLAGMLSATEVAQLEQKLVAYDDSTSTQIVIVTINSLEGNEVAQYAYTLGDEWGVGRKQKDNGVVILLAKESHDVTIATGRGMEGPVPDVYCRRIIDNIMIPQFKNGNFYQGLNDGVDVIIKLAAGEFVNDVSKEKKSPPIAPLIPIIIIIIIALAARRNRNNRGGGGVIGGGGWMGPLIWGSMMSGRGGGGGWSGGSGGGFGGFGGGGFGGGGASGKW